MTLPRPAVAVLRTVEQLRGLAHPIRADIIHALRTAPGPTSCARLGEQLGLPTNKVHYHVIEMERLGLIRVEDTHARGNLSEKLYGPVADFYELDPDFLQAGGPPDALGELMVAQLQAAQGDVRRLLARPVGAARAALVNSIHTDLRLSPDDARAWNAELDALVARFKARRDPTGVDLVVTLVTVPVGDGEARG